MTDEEMAEESFKRYRTTDEDYEDLNGGEKILVFNHEYGAEEQYHRLYKQGFLAGLKAGSQLDEVWHDYDAGEDCYEDSHEGRWVKRETGRPQWHDLRKDPKDLPKDNVVLIQTESNCHFIALYYPEEKWWGTYEMFSHEIHGKIIAWCELPTFDKEV